MVEPLMQTDNMQYLINSVRSYVYPWIYGDGSFEANEILPGVWLGNWSSALDKGTLKRKGITHVLTAVYDIEPIYPEEFTYMMVPVVDTASSSAGEIIYQYFDKAARFIQDALDQKGSVLVHCVYGYSRSCTLVCAYLMKAHGLTPLIALNMVKLKRPAVRPNKTFIALLNRYHKALD